MLHNNFNKLLVNKKIYFLVFSRMNSSRLKNKAMLKISNYSIIEIIILRLLKKISKDRIIICTTKDHENGFYNKLAKKYQIKIFYGSEINYIQRAIKCIDKYKIKYFYRINGDNPLIDYLIFERFVNKLNKNSDSDYIYCNNILRGTRTELISTKSIKKLYKIIKDKYSSEYLSYYYFRNNLFNKIIFKVSKCENLEKNYTVALDSIVNFDIIKQIIEAHSIYVKRSEIFHFLVKNKLLKKAKILTSYKIPLVTKNYDVRIIGDKKDELMLLKY